MSQKQTSTPFFQSLSRTFSATSLQSLWVIYEKILLSPLPTLYTYQGYSHISLFQIIGLLALLSGISQLLYLGPLFHTPFAPPLLLPSVVCRIFFLFGASVASYYSSQWILSSSHFNGLDKDTKPALIEAILKACVLATSAYLLVDLFFFDLHFGTGRWFATLLLGALVGQFLREKKIFQENQRFVLFSILVALSFSSVSALAQSSWGFSKLKDQVFEEVMDNADMIPGTSKETARAMRILGSLGSGDLQETTEGVRALSKDPMTQESLEQYAIMAELSLSGALDEAPPAELLAIPTACIYKSSGRAAPLLLKKANALIAKTKAQKKRLRPLVQNKTYQEILKTPGFHKSWKKICSGEVEELELKN